MCTNGRWFVWLTNGWWLAQFSNGWLLEDRTNGWWLTGLSNVVGTILQWLVAAAEQDGPWGADHNGNCFATSCPSTPWSLWPLWPLWPQATTPNIEMSVWLLCSCEAAINNARIVAATIIYSSEANRLIWKNEGCPEPDVDVKVKLKWGWSLNAAQTEYTSGRRLLKCLPGKIKQECPNNNAAHRSITNDKKIPLIMEAVSPFKLLTRLLHCLNCWQCL